MAGAGFHMKPNQTITLTAPDQAQICIHRWTANGQGKPQLHWAHANGFNAQTYNPLLGDLAKHFDVMAWDMRGHGQSRNAGRRSSFKGWGTYYQDMITLLDQVDEPIWLAGHSIGATTSLAAACARPDKVKGLLLAEPVLLDRKQGLMLQMANRLGFAHRISLAASAAKRRSEFESRQTAYANYRAKRAFQSWDNTWLQSYVDHAFVETSQNTVELACPPHWESLSFQHTEPNASKWLRDLDCPVHILAASHGSTFPAAAHARIQKKLPKARIEVIQQASHFLPMEHTGLLIERIRNLAGL